MMNRCPPKRIAIAQLNQHLTCALCSGYLIDATTIVECLHSFCRACLLRYFETSNTCPICDTEINESQLDKSIRADRSLQDLVYKLIPGLYKSEFQRRKEFCMKYYDESSDACASSSAAAKDTAIAASKVLMQIFDRRLIELASRVFAPDDIIVFSLECHTKSIFETIKSDTKLSELTKSKTSDFQKQMSLKRYFRCQAAVKIGHLKKMLRNKFDSVALSEFEVEIFYNEDTLSDNWALMDVATVYCWDRKSALKMHFELCKYEIEEEPMPNLFSEINRSLVAQQSFADAEKRQISAVIPNSNPVKFNIDKILTVEKPEPSRNVYVSESKDIGGRLMGKDDAGCNPALEAKFTPPKKSEEPLNRAYCANKTPKSTDSVTVAPFSGPGDGGGSLINFGGDVIKRPGSSSSPLSLIDVRLLSMMEKPPPPPPIVAKSATKIVRPRAKKSLNTVVQQLFTTTSFGGVESAPATFAADVGGATKSAKSRSKKSGETRAKLPTFLTNGVIATTTLTNGEPNATAPNPPKKRSRESAADGGVPKKPRRPRAPKSQINFVNPLQQQPPVIGPQIGPSVVSLAVDKAGLNLSDLNLFARPGPLANAKHSSNDGNNNNVEAPSDAEPPSHANNAFASSCNSQISCA